MSAGADRSWRDRVATAIYVTLAISRRVKVCWLSRLAGEQPLSAFNMAAAVPGQGDWRVSAEGSPGSETDPRGFE